MFIHFVFFFVLQRSVDESYRQKIAELQEGNERKDLRIELLEQKLQKLRVNISVVNREKEYYLLFS